MKEIMKKIIERIKQLIFKPKETWDMIKAEETDEMGILKNYLLILTAFPALALFIGRWAIGLQIGNFFPYVKTYRFGFWSSFVTAVFWYVLTIASIWLAGKVISYLAPKFGSLQNDLNAFKLSVYSSTPLLVAGLLRIIPNLEILVVILGIWGFVILYFGLPIMMETPDEKKLPYYVVSVAIYICIYIILGAIISILSKIFGPDLPVPTS